MSIFDSTTDKHLKMKGATDELILLVANNGKREILWHSFDTIYGDTINGERTSANVEYSTSGISYNFEINVDDGAETTTHSVNLNANGLRGAETTVKVSQQMYKTLSNRPTTFKTAFYEPLVPCVMESQKSLVSPTIFNASNPIDIIYYSGLNFVKYVSPLILLYDGSKFVDRGTFYYPSKTDYLWDTDKIKSHSITQITSNVSDFLKADLSAAFTGIAIKSYNTYLMQRGAGTNPTINYYIYRYDGSSSNEKSYITPDYIMTTGATSVNFEGFSQTNWGTPSTGNVYGNFTVSNNNQIPVVVGGGYAEAEVPHKTVVVPERYEPRTERPTFKVYQYNDKQAMVRFTAKNFPYGGKTADIEFIFISETDGETSLNDIIRSKDWKIFNFDWNNTSTDSNIGKMYVKTPDTIPSECETLPMDSSFVRMNCTTYLQYQVIRDLCNTMWHGHEHNQTFAASIVQTTGKIKQGLSSTFYLGEVCLFANQSAMKNDTTLKLKYVVGLEPTPASPADSDYTSIIGLVYAGLPTP